MLGSADPATHKIYIWDISSDGQFATALDGGREPLLDVNVRMIFCSVVLYADCSILSGIQMRPPWHRQLCQETFCSGTAQLPKDGAHLPAGLRKLTKMSFMKNERTSLILYVTQSPFTLHLADADSVTVI